MNNKKVWLQRAMGLALLDLCVVYWFLATIAPAWEDTDATPLLILAPIAVWLIVSRRQIIY